MSRFINAAQCERCWFRAHTFAPLRVVRVAHPEPCHSCGWPTVAGIFVRVPDNGPPPPRPELILEAGDQVLIMGQGGAVRGYVVDDDGVPVRDTMARPVQDVVEGL